MDYYEALKKAVDGPPGANKTLEIEPRGGIIPRIAVWWNTNWRPATLDYEAGVNTAFMFSSHLAGHNMISA